MLLVPALAQENLGARPMGMGGAFTGLADDVNAIFINPAGIGSLNKESAMVSTRLSEGREYNMIGGVEITPFGNLGVGYVGSTDPVDQDLSGLEGGTPVKYTTQTLYVSLSKDLNREIRVSRDQGTLLVGMNLKFSSRRLGTANGLFRDGGSNVDVDLASIFKPNDNLSLGLSLQNFLGGKKYSDVAGLNTVEEKNYTILTGISGKLLDGSLTLSADGEELGCEWQLARGISIRAGRGKDSVTSGFGININGFSVDYAYLQKDSPVHYWSVSIIPQDEASMKRAAINLE